MKLLNIKDKNESKAINSLFKDYNLTSDHIHVKDSIIVSLSLFEKNLSSIPEEIQELPNLRKLILSRNQISRLEYLDNLGKLKILGLSENNIKKIENLDALYSLERLFLFKNKIEKLENLNSQYNLIWLILKQNRIKKIEKNSSLKKLKLLDLSFNYIKRIENFENLHNLKKLLLNDNLLDENPDLSSLRELEICSLWNNNFKYDFTCSECGDSIIKDNTLTSANFCNEFKNFHHTFCGLKHSRNKHKTSSEGFNSTDVRVLIENNRVRYFDIDLYFI